MASMRNEQKKDFERGRIERSLPPKLLDATIIYMTAGPEPPFKMDGDYSQYVTAHNEERRAILMSNAMFVTNYDPYNRTLAEEHNSFLIKKQKDELLKDNWRFDFMKMDDSGVARRYLAQKTLLGRYPDPADGERNLMFAALQKIKEDQDFGDLTPFLQNHIPPARRLLIHPNITFNRFNPIPVYCDITEDIENLKIPPTFAFDYTDSVFVNATVEKTLAFALEKAKNPVNQIKCTCKKDNKECYENPDCPCYQMNSRMQKLQPKTHLPPTEFSSYNPILFKHPFNPFYNHCGFACSELCECGGQCNNNAMLLIEKNVFPLEIYRIDMIMGFMVRSPVFIPAGTPVMDFTGELLEHENLPETHEEYAYQCAYSNDEKWKILIKELDCFEHDYKNVLLHMADCCNFYIDPTHFGNIGRMAAHSCCANMEIVRVYKRSLSPAHMSLVLVTLEDIYPGTPLSIDYGLNYADRLSEVCKCGTFACRASEATKKFQKYDAQNLAMVIKKLHEMRTNHFRKSVLEPLERVKEYIRRERENRAMI